MTTAIAASIAVAMILMPQAHSLKEPVKEPLEGTLQRTLNPELKKLTLKRYLRSLAFSLGQHRIESWRDGGIGAFSG